MLIIFNYLQMCIEFTIYRINSTTSYTGQIVQDHLTYKVTYINSKMYRIYNKKFIYRGWWEGFFIHLKILSLGSTITLLDRS